MKGGKMCVRQIIFIIPHVNFFASSTLDSSFDGALEHATMVKKKYFMYVEKIGKQ